MLSVTKTCVYLADKYAEMCPEMQPPLDKDQVLRHVPTPKPRMQPDFRRPGLACRPLTADERQMVERWMTLSPLGNPGD